MKSEQRIAQEFDAHLRARGWLVELMHGNAYQRGVPDRFAYRDSPGMRWIDYKVAGRYSFTPAQRRKWPVWSRYGIGVWIITSVEDYPKLFAPPNWLEYWPGPAPTAADVDRLCNEIRNR